jgi:hypothetical protein
VKEKSIQGFRWNNFMKVDDKLDFFPFDIANLTYDYIVDKQSTQDDKYLSWLSSPFQKQG